MNRFRSRLLSSSSRLTGPLAAAGIIGLALTSASFAQAPAASDAEPSIESQIPLPDPANVPPITADSIGGEKPTTATVPPVAAPAPAPAQASFPPPPGRATEPSTPS